MINIPKDLIASLNAEAVLHPLKGSTRAQRMIQLKNIFLTSQRNKIESF